MKEENLEELGDVIQNFINILYAMQLQMPAQIHLDILSESIPAKVKRLIAIYIECGGENHWEDEEKLK